METLTAGLEFISHSVQTMIFLAIAGISFVILSISFFAGSIFGTDHDIPHDHDVASGHDVAGGHDGEYGSTVSVFSPKIFFVFTMGFGAAGAIASIYHCGSIVSSLYGLLSGLVFGAIAYLGLSLLYKQQANSVINTDKAINQVGVVTTTINSGGLGEVTVNVLGNSRTYTAQEKGGGEIGRGKKVRVIQNMGGTLLVEAI
jgi:membrane protein implicated in regulation of membrane protease activity